MNISIRRIINLSERNKKVASRQEYFHQRFGPLSLSLPLTVYLSIYLHKLSVTVKTSVHTDSSQTKHVKEEF